MPDPAPFQFVQQPSGIYYAQTAPPGRFAMGNLNVAYITGSTEAIPLPNQPPVTRGLSDSWAFLTDPSQGSGAYLFLGQRIVNEAGFIAALRAQFAEPSFKGARVLWVINPNARRDQWQLSALRVVNTTAQGGVVAALTSFGFRNYGVAFEQGCIVTVDDSSSTLTVSAPPGRPNAIFLTARNGAVRLNQITGPVRIPFANDAGVGCLNFPLTIPTVDAGAPSPQEILDVGCRFFFPAYRLQGKAVLTSLSYPIFDTSGTDTSKPAYTLEASLDPLAPADPAFTTFAFTADSLPIPSFYRSNVGKAVQLTPAPGSRLTFASRNTFASSSGDRDPLYLVPDGPFHVTTDGAQPNLLCGIYGAEFVELDKSSVLTFVAGQPAYLSSFDPATGIPDTQGGVPQFSGPATTSFAAASSAASRLCYSAVPEGAGYFGASGAAAKLMPYFPACAAFLPVTGPDRPTAYPLVPYAGVQASDLTAHRLLETEVLSRQRRQLIRSVDTGGPLPAAPTQAADGQTHTVDTITPQGLLATFSADRATWSILKIAQTPAGPDPKNPFVPLAFSSVGEPLRSALLTSQQFLVISDAQAFRPYFQTDNQADIAGWNFLMDPAGWGAFGTILIIKNHEKSLKELAVQDPNIPGSGDTGKWTLGGTFNASLRATQLRLADIIQKAEDAENAAKAADLGQGPPTTAGQPAPDHDFANFVSIVNDPGWNGILVLNCPLSPTDLPMDLETLAAGIDPSGFVAHHFGINQTPVSADDLDLKHTSLFALIHYQAPAVARTLAKFDFRVTSLRALFLNSVVAFFSAKVELTLNELFGARATAIQPATSNTVPLNGTYEKHGDTSAFVLAGNTSTVLALEDAVLEGMEIDKTRVSTRISDAGSVESRFSFWGNLKFKALQSGNQAFDLFSYDSLSFSNLALGMSFQHSNPQARTFQFDPSELAFDSSQSIVRKTGLARHFPLKLKSFLLSNDAGDLPTGYASVDVPLDRQKPAAPWYGLVFDLSLGTLGDLAADAGIAASMVTLWSPGTSLRIFTGLKIPGLTGGGSQFSLMGILKLKMQSLELISSGGAFQLMLNGISLSLMGKSLPPGASFDFFVYGDPNESSGSDALAWYGDFKKQAGG